MTQETGYWILDAGQIMDDLVPIYQPEGGAFIGDTGYKIQDTRYKIQDTGYRIQDTIKFQMTNHQMPVLLQYLNWAFGFGYWTFY